MGQNTKSKLTLNCMAIGSLPHKNSEKAMELVEKNFFEIPFWAQLTSCLLYTSPSPRDS